MQPLILENKTLHLEFCQETGALMDITGVEKGWKVLDRPHLGLSFQLLLPLNEERRNNPVYGEKQKLTNLKVSPDGKTATFTWDGVTSELGGTHNIRLDLEVKLTERQAIYTMTVANHSPYTVENVFCPYLGDVTPPADEAWFKTFSYNYASSQEWSLYPTYQNLRGYYGSDYPVQISGWGASCGAPMTPFFLLRGQKQGLYAGVCAPSSELVAWQTELRPGYGSSIDARVPETRNISGIDVQTRFAAIHVPYIQPGETRTLTPVALEIYQGGWHQGVDIYKQWRSTWFTKPALPDWVKDPHSWQQIQVNAPEDELRIPYKELVKVGEECARHGVKAIQVTGWEFGGQDQGNPCHDIDNRLGTWEDLRDAIARVQAMGVKIVLFCKYTWADRATEWFRKDLVRLAIKDPYGDYQIHQGYQYHTATQLLDINTKRLVPMCFLAEEYLTLCNKEFQKVLDLGADGILFDECLHHTPALLCFDESHSHRYGAPVYANDRVLIQNFAALAAPVKKDFLFCGEACYDWEFEAYHFSYHRSENKEHIPLTRYIDPALPLATAVTGFDDRNMINQCLMYRYIISYEPYNFKGHLDVYPLTMEYGKKMDALRTELRDYFWDGEFRDKVGAEVTTAEGKPHHPYAVYINAKNGKKGLVIPNYDEKTPVTVQVKLEGAGKLERYRLVDDPTWKLVDGGITIPPLSAVVVI